MFNFRILTILISDVMPLQDLIFWSCWVFFVLISVYMLCLVVFEKESNVSMFAGS